MPDATLFRLLGHLEVVRDGRPLDLGGPKQRTVLAVLLLEVGRVVSAARIADALWGEQQPATATATIQGYVSKLRRALSEAEAPSIVRRAQGYVLEVPDGQVDVAVFAARAREARTAVQSGSWDAAVAAAEQALELWRGVPLADFADEEWVQAPAAHLEELRVECTENLIRALLGADRVTEALGHAGVLALSAPFSERAAWLRILAVHRAGRPAQALAAYTDFTETLTAELGLSPGPDLTELHRRMLRQDPGLLVWPRERTDWADPARPRGGLVGRDHELSLIDETLKEALDGRTRWLALSGPAGIGKSRLADETASRWRAEGARTIRVTCPEDDGLPLWWPIRELLRALGADAEGVLTPPAGAEADAATFVVAEQVQTELAKATASGALLILLDDAQWADAASLRFLTNLATTSMIEGLLVVLTVRDREVPARTARLLTAVGRHPGGRHLAVPALTALEVAELVAEVSGRPLDPGEARQLTEHTGGNPFFVQEFARLPASQRGAGQVPAGVRSVVTRRLSSLPPGVLDLLRAGAVIGDPIGLDVLAAVAETDIDALADVLDELVAEGLIVQLSGGYGFAHGLLRDEVLLGTPPVRRQRLHARVARALESTHPVDQARRATHMTAALPFLAPEQVYQACREAALEAEAQWDSDSASRWWDAAVRVFSQVPPRPGSDTERDELLEAQVNALGRAGHDQRALDAVDAALLIAGRQNHARSVGRLASALLRTAGGWPWVSYASDPGPLVTRLASLEPLTRADPAAHARVLAALAVGNCYDPDHSLREQLSARAISVAEQGGDEDALADALLARAVTYSGVITKVGEVKALLLRLIGLPHKQARLDKVLAHNMLSWAEMTLGNIAAAEEHRRLGVGGCDLLRLPVARAQLRWAEGALAQWHGDHERAASVFEHAYELHRSTELYSSGVYDIAMTALRWDRGTFRDASHLREPDATSEPWDRLGRCVATGQAAEAGRLITAELSSAGPDTWTTYGKLTMVAHFVADLGARGHAPALIARLQPIEHCIATIGHVGVVGPVSLALARLHHLLGDDGSARRQLATAVLVSESQGGGPSLQRCRELAAQIAGPGTPLPTC
ncbi:AAA family ATPase [Kineosporia rhizophila]|uniref:BTAD domain-containing putative transcriptional regulator n=1 Tax=Kineosporia rhizophila TaxID=84633 RepID=UPI001E3B71B0|nr:AAA family ATPase [Kineosporia rhizophila]